VDLTAQSNEQEAVDLTAQSNEEPSVPLLTTPANQRSRVANMINYIRTNRTAQERPRLELGNEEDFVPLPSPAPNEDDQFSTVDCEASGAAPNSYHCPQTLKEMILIVQDLRLQREDYMRRFTPVTREDTPVTKSRRNNYDSFVTDLADEE
jgi:hypothetical protein